jgi:hypothetical protein
MLGYKQVANIVDDWPLIKQNPGARARGKKERSSITRYTSPSSKSMLVSYRRDAVPCQRDSKSKESPIAQLLRANPGVNGKQKKGRFVMTTYSASAVHPRVTKLYRNQSN